MTQFDIQNNINAEIEKFRTAYPIDIVYPNTDYTPVEGTDYIQVFYINGVVTQVEFGQNSPNRTATILQMNIITSPNEGNYQAKVIVDAMQPYFKRGQTIHNNALFTRVTSFILVDPVEEAHDYMQIVRVATRSDYEN